MHTNRQMYLFGASGALLLFISCCLLSIILFACGDQVLFASLTAAIDFTCFAVYLVLAYFLEIIK